MSCDSVKVLVVDDDPAVREDMTVILQAFGYACRPAQDGLDALDKLAGEPFDLLVTDLDMPRLGGLELIERIRASSPDMPIMIMTSRRDFESGQRALRLGVSDYLVKPFEDPAEVEAAARRALLRAAVKDAPDGMAWELTSRTDPSAEQSDATPCDVEQPEDAPRIRGYRLLATLGSGRVGTVYKAVHVASRRIVALKVLPFGEGTEQNVTCLLRETQVAARLQHPNIIRGFGAGVDGGYFYVAMEYVEGESLADLLDHDGALPEPRALQITREIVGALAHAWAAGLVHRDVKPDNIMLTKDGVAKLADLGATRDLTGLLNTISSEGVVVGTPLYISPEQAQGMSGVDWRADVYGLGATLYHMVCGMPPFDRSLGATSLLLKHVSEEPIPAYLRRITVSLHVSRLIGMMMQKDRAKRHASPGDLLADVVRVMHGLPPELAAGTPLRGKQAGAGLS